MTKQDIGGLISRGQIRLGEGANTSDKKLIADLLGAVHSLRADFAKKVERAIRHPDYTKGILHGITLARDEAQRRAVESYQAYDENNTDEIRGIAMAQQCFADWLTDQITQVEQGEDRPRER